MQLKNPIRYLPLFAAIFAITPLAIDMYLPAMPTLARFFDSNMTQVQWSLSIFLAGYAVGMLLFGPMADHFGRRWFLLGGLTGFTMCSLALSFCTTIESFIIIRMAQAICGGAATVTVPGTIRDLFGTHTAKGLAYVSMAMMIAPMLAPSIGSLILVWFEWHVIFVVLGIYAVVILLFTFWKFPFLPPTAHRNESLSRSILRNYSVVFKNFRCYPFLLTTMITTLVFFTYITSVSFVYIEVYHASEQLFGLLFGANVLALMSGNFINARLVTRFGPMKMLRTALLGAIIAASFLFFTLYQQASLAWVVACILFLMANLIIVSTNSDALILMSFPHQSGTATAVIGTLKFGSGAIAGLILAILQDGTALPFGLLVLSSVAIIIGIQLTVLFFRLPIPGQN